MTSLRFVLLASASMAFAPAALMAQSTADLIDLGTLTLEGAPDPTDPVAGYVADYAQTATKTSAPLLETPQSVSVITGEQIEDQGATTLGDTLGYTSGVTAQPYGTDPRFDSPTLRGFNASNGQYLNGLRILRELGAPSFEIYSLERIEVLKGPASVLYGAGIPGGVINQVQKRAHLTEFGEVGIGFGDPKATEAFVDANHVFSDTFAARVTAVGRDSEEDVEDLSNERKYLGLATRWTPTDQTDIQFLGSYQKDSPITPAGVPYGLVGVKSDEELRDFYVGDPTDDESERTTQNLGLEATHEFDNGWSVDLSYRQQQFDWDYTGFYVANSAASTDSIARGGINQSEESVTSNLDLRLRGNVQTGAISHDLLFGLDSRTYSLNETTEFMSADAIDFENPSYSGANLTAPWYIATKDLELTQQGIYAQDEMAWDNWRMSLALRHDQAEQSGTTWNNFGGTSDASQENEATTGRAGVTYVMPNGVAAFASFSTSFDPVIGTDIDGKKLDVTRGEMWETGVKYQPEGFKGSFQASYYEIQQYNLTASTTRNGVSGLTQIGEAFSKGVELEGSVDLADGWNIRAAYAWNDATQTAGDNAGKELPNAPMHNSSLWVNYAFDGGTFDGLTLGGGARYLGERYGDAANAYALDAVTLYDVQAAYEITDNAHVSLNVSNLTDEAYVANCGSFGCYYGDGRTVQARLTYKW